MLHFSPYRFDDVERSLWRDAEQVRITRRAAAVLACLLERAGTVVPKADMLSIVWGDTHVLEANVKVVVRELRAALHDDPLDPRYIASIRGRGYKFLVVPGAAPAAVIDGDRARAHQAAAAVRTAGRSRLEQLYEAAERESRPGFVVVEGERGMGKTTFVESFAAALSGRARIAVGRAVDDTGGAEPLWPLIDALDDLVRRAPGLMEPLIRRHAPAWMGRVPHCASPATPRPETPLATMASELAVLLEIASEHVPLVVILEDLQWSDRETLAVVGHLAARVRAARLLVVATRVPPPAEPASPAMPKLSDAAGNRVVTLTPLTRAAVESYLAIRFGDACARALAGPVAAASMGHPTLLSLIVDGLIAMECLTRHGRGWRAIDTSAIGGAVAACLPDAFGWHVTRLSPDARRVLEAAAVVGQRFTADAVAAALGSRVLVVERLDGLVSAGVLRRSPRTTPAEYRFRHPLYAEAVSKAAPLFDRFHQLEHLDASSPQPVTSARYGSA